MGQGSIDPEAFREFEAAGWEKASDAYHRFFGPITGRLIPPLLDAARVGPGSRVLDVATGPGYVAAQARQRGASAVGIDIAHQMVASPGGFIPGRTSGMETQRSWRFLTRRSTRSSATSSCCISGDRSRRRLSALASLSPAGRSRSRCGTCPSGPGFWACSWMRSKPRKRLRRRIFLQGRRSFGSHRMRNSLVCWSPRAFKTSAFAASPSPIMWPGPRNCGAA